MQTYYIATVKLFLKDDDMSRARETIKEALDSLTFPDNSLITWGFLRTGDATRAFPSPVKDQHFAANLEDMIDKANELKMQPRARLSEAAQEELDMLENDNEESFDNL